jgi:BolA protein
MSLDPTAANLEARLQAMLQPSRLEVLDESHQHAGHAGANGSGFGTHFRVRIASPLFTNCGRVARHRLVYDALQDFIDQGLHALAIEAEETSPATPGGVSV